LFSRAGATSRRLHGRIAWELESAVAAPSDLKTGRDRHCGQTSAPRTWRSASSKTPRNGESGVRNREFVATSEPYRYQRIKIVATAGIPPLVSRCGACPCRFCPCRFTLRCLSLPLGEAKALLFDLAGDPYETTDRAADQPDRVKQLQAVLKQQQEFDP
jgi:hypothetical protein